MSGPVGSQQWMYATSGGGFYPDEIDNSARLDTNAYFQRTPSSSGSRTTWTWNAWVKLGSIGQTEVLFTARTAGQSAHGQVYFEAGKLAWDEYNGASNTLRRHTTQVFRDPSAWYMVTIVADTTNATASNRGRVYINGTQVTEFSVNVNPSQNQVLETNQNITHRIGANTNNLQYFNGYLAEVNFVDGQALDPTSFGETKSGVWIPKSYSGTHGTNGFYLDFATRATDPIDASGNGNNWSSTNVASYDWMLDSPTNNFPTFSPAALDNDRDYLTLLAEGNLRIDKGILSGEGGSIGVPFAVSSGKWYFEAELSEYSGSSNLRFGFNTDINFNGGGNAFKEVSANGLYMIAIDIDNKLYWTGTNGTWDAGDPDAGTGGTSYTSTVDSMVPYARDNSGSIGNGGTWTVNFGQDSSFAGNKTRQGNTDANGIGDFYYSVPTGHLAICSSNLPDPVIDPAQDDVPADYFNTVLYTGTGNSLSVTGVGFQPDLVWVKSRSTAGTSHVLVDAVRGDGRSINSDRTDAEALANVFPALQPDGFNLSGPSSWANTAPSTYVAWNWKAGGAGVSNTEGTITSTVSANTNAGFSIVTWTGDGNGSGNIGTGLSSSIPIDMAVVKRRDSTSEWQVGHRFSGQGSNFAYHLELNSTSQLSSNGPYMMGSQSTSSGDKMWLASGSLTSNATYVAYCFQSVEGFSKFGSYTGNGDADGPFIYTGFRPAYVIVKNASASDSWFINDNKRNSFNVVNSQLFANSANAEADSRGLDFLSNGFKIRDTSASHNGNGNTLIYMAFAEMPFKYANAR